MIMLSPMNLLTKNKQKGIDLFDACLTKPVKHSNLMNAILLAFHKIGLEGDRENLIKINNSDISQLICGIKCLLVEDNIINQKLAMIVLKKMGCQVDLAENGEIALDKIRINTYDIVFMDCQMPVMNGYEATSAIRKLEQDGMLTSHIPIIAITAHAMTGDREVCMRSGMDDYISKPINQVKIIEILKQYTNWINNESDNR